MKLFIKFIMFLVVLAVAGPFIMKGPDGRPLMTLKDLGLPNISLPKPPPPKLNGNEEGAWIAWSKDKSQTKETKVYVIDPKAQNQPVVQRPGVFYRWKNAEGVWQFSNTPNPDTLNIVIETNPNENVMQSLSTDKIDSALGRIREIAPLNAPETADMPSIPLPTTVPITEVPELINQAKAVQDLMNQRTEMLNNNQF